MRSELMGGFSIAFLASMTGGFCLEVVVVVETDGSLSGAASALSLVFVASLSLRLTPFPSSPVDSFEGFRVDKTEVGGASPVAVSLDVSSTTVIMTFEYKYY